MALFRVNQARKDLNNWLAQDPGRGSNNYSAALQNALNNAANRQTPAQRYNTGNDQNIQASRENYRLMAQRAADTAAAGAEALSGGYGADYAASAAEQGRQILMEGQHDNEQALRQLALQGLAAESSQADVLTQALLGAQQLEMNANQMAQARYQAQRDFLTGEVQQAQAEKDNVLGNLWDALVWAGQTALRTYDNYKGYSQQQIENWMAYQEFLSGEDQRQIDNYWRNQEWTASREDAAWKQKMDELAFTAGRTDADREYDLAVQQLALDDALTQAQIANYGRRSSGGSGGGSSGAEFDLGDFLALSSAYSDYSLSGQDDLAAQMDAVSQALYGIPLSGSTGGNFTTGAVLDVSSGLSLARSYIQRGWSSNEIMQGLIDAGYTDDQVASIMNRVR